MANRATLWLLFLLFLVLGCASTTTPLKLDQVNRMLNDAEAASAREYASYHFHRAVVFRDRARLEIAQAKYNNAMQYLQISEDSLKQAFAVTDQRKELERRRNQRQDNVSNAVEKTAPGAKESNP
mgnify:CR=1 FL=1